jgi:hypoxanthine-guanine phosphoribosyltransferase
LPFHQREEQYTDELETKKRKKIIKTEIQQETKHNKLICVCVISGFRHNVNDIYALWDFT